MTMLYAGSEEFRERFPRGAKLYDANGNRILHAYASNPDSGEVLRTDHRPRYPLSGIIFAALGFKPIEHPWLEWAFRWRWHSLHTFHPAPLMLIPNDPPAQA